MSVMVETRWAKPLEEAIVAAQRLPASRLVDAELEAEERARSSFDRGSPSLRLVMDDFVRFLKDNPKVWAVCADEDRSGIAHIWTYVDSTDRRDRSPVYRAEWQLLKRYPEVAFDFNVGLLSPAEGQSEIEAATCIYKR